MIRPTLFLLFFLLAGQAFGEAPNYPITTSDLNRSGESTAAADCPAAESKFQMEINNVRTTLLTGGDLWWDLSHGRYEVPKVPEGQEGQSVNSLFAGAIWVSGIDEGGNLKLAAQTYRQTGNDFWPGPINDLGSIEKISCQQFDRHFPVYGIEIDQTIANFKQSGETSIEYADIPINVRNWPGKGNPELEALGYDVSQPLAPFYDYDGDEVYDPRYGDYPVIDDQPETGEFVYADQMVFWVYNDVGNVHTQTGSDAIGLQINALSFAFATSDEINDMSFYRYNITNKSSQTLTETYMGQWVDPDLGCYGDDYVGCDTSRDLGIVYNADPQDEDCGSARGYGAEVPLLAVDFFEGPKDENGDQIGMSSFIYYNNAGGNQGDPVIAEHYRNYQTSKWKNGTCVSYNGNCVNYMYPGDPSDPNQWSMCSTSEPQEDRRFLQNSGPFVLKPGAENNITVGVVWVRPPVGTYPCPSFDKVIGVADDKAQALFDNGFKLIDGPDAPDLQIRELSNQLIIEITNPVGSNNHNESYNEVDPLITSLGTVDFYGNPIVDFSYTFQGYLVYQLKNAEVSASQLGDPSKAKLIAQVDKKDNVENIVNHIYDPITSSNRATLMVEGSNTGIQPHLLVTEDLFAEGDPKLINHKTYYFAVVAYAYNNYQTYDPNQPEAGGQRLPFLQGRRNFKVYSGIPHIHDPRNAGTVLNAYYGEEIPVTRISGQGNGGRVLRLTDDEVEAFLSNEGETSSLTYEAGHGPIGVQIVDPLTVKDAKFQLRMLDTEVMETDETKVIGRDQLWELWDVTSEPFLITTSAKGIGEATEQLIEDYGISVELHQPEPIYETGYQVKEPVDDIYAPIGAELTYDEPNRPWLNLLQDRFTNSQYNWLRSGGHQLQYGTPLVRVFDDVGVLFVPNQQQPQVTEMDFHDPEAHFSNLLEGRVGPYCLAANFFDPTHDFVPVIHAPGFKWLNLGAYRASRNTLDDLPSVQLVITPDKSQWSKCVVFETGEHWERNERHPDLDISSCSTETAHIGSRKGQIRMTYSLDINGNIDYSEYGRSWFPGYAVNLETGQRLNVAFGESSGLPDENGRDMIWNPTSFEQSETGEIFFGGKHYVYIFNSEYDQGAEAQQLLIDHYNETTGCNPYSVIPFQLRPVYEQMMYTFIPYTTGLSEFKTMKDGLVPDNQLSLNINVTNPYQQYITDDYPDERLPVYEFNTLGKSPQENQEAVAESALDLINVVPNPYYAYSSYETSQLDNRVKITNLPNNCTVSIYSISGQLIRTFDRDLHIDISEGHSVDQINNDNTLDWDLTNTASVPVASGIYYIHIDVPGVGERTLKWFGALRPTDLDTF